jgi:hypothetical protein
LGRIAVVVVDWCCLGRKSGLGKNYYSFERIGMVGCYSFERIEIGEETRWNVVVFAVVVDVVVREIELVVAAVVGVVVGVVAVVVAIVGVDVVVDLQETGLN